MKGGAPDPGRPPHRRHYRLLAVCALAVLLTVFHAPVLRSVAGGLVVEDRLERADAVVFLGANGPFGQVPLDEAASLYQDGLAARVILIEDRSPRVVRLGIVPTLASVASRKLADRGVPEAAFTALAVTAPGEWKRARCLGDWLSAHPDARVTVLCDQFASRRAAYLFRQVLGPEAAGRVRWRPLPDRRFDTTNWWRDRQGVVNLTGAYVALVYTWLAGEEEEGPQWDPDQYERMLHDRHAG